MVWGCGFWFFNHHLSGLFRAAVFRCALHCPFTSRSHWASENNSAFGSELFCYFGLQPPFILAFLQKILVYFHSHNIPYMLSGSVAMSVYTIPRAIIDFDFIVHRQPKDVDSFVIHFSGNHYCDAGAINEAIGNLSLFNVIDHSSGFKADFVILRNEAFRQEEFNRRKKVLFEGMELYIVLAEDLIISKLIRIQDFQSGIQIDDIGHLWEAAELDKTYIRKWLNVLKLNTFNLIND